jgi:hypothetical protein
MQKKYWNIVSKSNKRVEFLFLPGYIVGSGRGLIWCAFVLQISERTGRGLFLHAPIRIEGLLSFIPGTATNKDV